MRRHLNVLTLVLATAGLGGCLVKDTTHRVYLSPDGAMLWSVREESVRSDAGDRAGRQREEAEWLDAVARDAHPVAEAFWRLSPERVSTSLVRTERPYSATIAARFDRVDRVLARLIDELGVRGGARLEVDGTTTTLSVWLDAGSLNDSAAGESPVVALLEDLDRYRVELTEGRFVAATGFEIVRDGTAAVLQVVLEETMEAGGTLMFRLSWSIE
jgi:hypothetical protein